MIMLTKNVKVPRVLFFGNNSMVLDSIIKNSNVVAIFCRPADRSNETIMKIKETGKKHSIPVKQPIKKDLHNYTSYIRNLDIDLIVVCGYKYIIPNEIFDIPEFRTINIHPSYLPAYRGQHVVNWAIINGEKETGVTIHYIDEGIDTGDIIVQKKVPISSEDNAKTLHDKIYDVVCELVMSVMHCIASGKQIKGKKQDDTKASYYRPRVPDDGKIDWNKSGVEIYDLIRALVKPWPGAYGYIKGNKIVIWGAKFEASTSCNGSYGEICAISNSNFTVNINDGKLIVDEYTVFDKNGTELTLDIEVGDQLQ